MYVPSPLRADAWAAAFSMLLLFGCATPLEPVPPRTPDPVSDAREWTPLKTGGPGHHSQDGFYPLRIGNRWLHRQEFTVTVIPDVGAPQPAYRYLGRAEREIVCAERLFRGWYLVEQQRELSSEGPGPSRWIRYRQDRTGLYEADVATSEHPACPTTDLASPAGRPAPLAGSLPPADGLTLSGSAAEQAAYREAWARVRERVAALRAALSHTWRPELPGELTRLRYPLRPGATWVIRHDPGLRFWATVEGHEILDLPPGPFSASRIRIRSTAFGPRDVVHVWYGPAGFLQLTAHFEFEARDVSGNVYGRAVAEQRESLEDLWVPGYGTDAPRKGPVAAQ